MLGAVPLRREFSPFYSNRVNILKFSRIQNSLCFYFSPTGGSWAQLITYFNSFLIYTVMMKQGQQLLLFCKMFCSSYWAKCVEAVGFLASLGTVRLNSDILTDHGLLL